MARYPRCPRCASEETHISYYGCDTEPYPFKGFGIDCWRCGLVFDSVSVRFDVKNINFDDLRDANMTRCVEWMGAYPKAENIAFHGLELGGEAGEAQNLCKKIARYYLDGIPGFLHPDEAKPALAEELADVIICVDMIAATLNIDLARAVEEKFNATSEKHGFETRLGEDKV